jgi:hypothetical protein
MTPDLKPPLWAFTPAAVDPHWVDSYWANNIATVPGWEGSNGSQTPMIIGMGALRTGNRYATPQYCINLAGTAGWTSTSKGTALSLPLNQDWELPSVVATNNDMIPADRVTYLIVRQKTSTTINTSQGHSAGIVLGGGAAASRAGIQYPFTDGVVSWDFGGSSSPNRLSWSGYVPSTSIESWGFVAGTRGSAIYFNGNQVASQSTAITRTVLSSAINSRIGMNIANTLSNGLPQNILFFGILDAEWTAGQMLEWAEDEFAPIRMWDQSFISTAPTDTIFAQSWM